MKEKEIRDTEVLDQYLELVARDVADFFIFRSFKKVSCPACGRRSFQDEFIKTGFQYVTCKACATLFVNPRPTYDMLKQFYSLAPSSRFWVEKFFMPVAEARREKLFKPRAEYMKTMIPKKKGMVIGDIGAGFGLFLEEFRKVSPGHDYIAIEPSPEMGDICRKKGLQVREMCLEDMDLSRDGESFDLLTAFELTEHLYDPFSFIQRVHALLKKDGRFLLTTLNGQGFDIALLWENSKSVNPPHHLNFFNPKSMVYLLEKAGFQILEVETPGRLDWDIFEKAVKEGKFKADRFWTDFVTNGSDQSKDELQHWIARHRMSSHMRILAKK